MPSEDMEIYGYAGKILQVDLSSGTVATFDTACYSKDYLGGRGICQKLYWDLVGPEVKPFDPENCLIFMTGVFGGTGAPSASRMFLAFKSPATYPHEEYFSSNMAGGFGPALKRAGYDGLIILGKALSPSYLLIQDDTVELRSAGSIIWGLDTFSAKDELWRRHGKDAEIMAIGQAGENMVREAIIQTSSNDSFSQGGPGAVMGSKKLKAVVVQGSGGIKVAHPKELLNTINECNHIITKKLTEEGPINPFRSLWQAFPSELAMEAQKGTASVKPASCDACPLACKTAYHYLDGGGAGVMKCSIGGGLYSKATFGAEAGDDGAPPEDMEPPEGGMPFMKIDRTVCDAINLWERYGVNGHFLEMYSQGLDGILYRLIDAGIITEENSGLPLDKRGEIEFARVLLRKIALREEGFGDEMAEGPARFCEKFGDEAMKLWHENYYEGEGTLNVDQFLMTKNHGEGNYPDILNRAFGIRTNEGYAYFKFFNPNVDPMMFDPDRLAQAKHNASAKLFGDEHLFDDPDDPDNGLILAFYLLKQCMIRDSVGQCGFIFPKIMSSYTDDYFGGLYNARFLNAILDTKYTEDELADEYALRMINLERLIKLREGREKADDVVPDVFFDDHGGYYDRSVFEKKVLEYYGLLGWDVTTGLPTKATLAQVGLTKEGEEFEQKCGVKLPE